MNFSSITKSDLLFDQVSKAFVLPYIKAEGDRLKQILEGPIVSNIERIAADHVKSHIIVSNLIMSEIFCTLLL